MNITNIDKDPLVPKLDIILYEDDGAMYVEASKIKYIGGAYKATGYYPLAINSLETLIKGTGVKSKGRFQRTKVGFDGLMPQNVIHYEPGATYPSIVWLVEAQERQFYLNEKEGKLWYPHLIFWIDRRIIRVYATKTKIIDRATMLYKAPFPNVFTAHNICWGTVRENFESNNYTTYMKNVENSFFNSSFTNEMMSFDRSKTPTIELLNKLKNSGKRFPAKELIKLNYLEDVIIG